MDTPPTPPPAAPPVSAAPPPASATTEDKTTAILSYFTLLGFIVAAVLNSNKKTQLGAFHLRQTLGFYLTIIAVAFCEIVLFFIPILGWLCIFALWVSIFVLWVMGLISAIQGQTKPMPIVGPLYQKWFGNTFS